MEKIEITVHFPETSSVKLFFVSSFEILSTIEERRRRLLDPEESTALPERVKGKYRGQGFKEMTVAYYFIPIYLCQTHHQPSL